MTTIAVLTTIDSLEQARAISMALVERKLAACVQISAIESFYAWEGSTQDDQEFRVMAKTTEKCYRGVEAAIRELHTYELPAMYAFGMTHVFEPYAEWVAEHSIPGEV
jgi:periplasmic divalent cation tolerance protein